MSNFTPHPENLIAKGSGRAAKAGRDFDPRITTLGGFKVGDKVRIVNGHYEQGSFDHGIIRGFWSHNGNGIDGAVVRFHTRNLTEVDPYIHPKTPAFDDGGYTFDDLAHYDPQH